MTTHAMPNKNATRNVIRVEIAHRVKAGEAASASELVRTALVEYFERHPAKSA